MPDVARSLSFRDETSDGTKRLNEERRRRSDDDDDDDDEADPKLPRSVSFNRDVRIKRIGPVQAPSNGQFVRPVRKEKLGRLSEKELADEAARVLEQAGRISCVSSDKGVVPEKFYSLPNRGKKHRRPKTGNDSPTSSIEQSTVARRRSEELGTTTPTSGAVVGPKKPPRTFLSRSVSAPKRPQRTVPRRRALVNPFRAEKSVGSSTKDVALRRSKSDASDERTKHKKRTDNDVKKKTQLSPIIEASPPIFEPKSTNDDYFAAKKRTVVIDVENAEKVAGKPKKKGGFRETIRALTFGRNRKSAKRDVTEVGTETETGTTTGRSADVDDEISKIVRELQETVREVEESDRMIHHGGQRTRESATRGRRVDDMVKRLSRDKFTPPPRTAGPAMVSPTLGMQHNNNRPFSYTKPSSPEYGVRNSSSPDRDYYRSSPDRDPAHPRYRDDVVNFRKPYAAVHPADYPRSLSPEIGLGGVYHRSPSPRPGDTPRSSRPDADDDRVIYAQVVCGSTVDDNKKKSSSRRPVVVQHNSDSDEGLGYEDRAPKWHGNDETPIRPKYLEHKSASAASSYARTSFADIRGRADGMDAIKRRDSVTERGVDLLNGSRGDLSSRREQLESRINSRTLQRKHKNESDVFERRYVSETSYARDGDQEPIGYVERYVAETRARSPEQRRTTYKTSRATKYVAHNERLVRSKDKEHHRSNPELIVRRRHETEEVVAADDGTYHDSLRRQRHDAEAGRRPFDTNNDSVRSKDRFVDSGIENDFRRDSGENVRVVVAAATSTTTTRHGQGVATSNVQNESEDEGFASSLLIASERQHTEENVERRNEREYRKGKKNEYVPRERSIDDGSHFDPRIDRDVDGGGTLKRVDKKPPKAEKKISGLDKVKSLFTSKKTKEKRKAERLEHETMMVREEEMRARYKEYRGSAEQLDARSPEFDHSGRKRLATPRSSPTPTSQRKLTRETKPTKQTKETNGWFKSLDRLGRRNKEKTSDRPASSKIVDKTISEDETYTRYYQPNKTKKNLRFFGDTDIESDASVRYKTSLKHRPSLNGSDVHTTKRSHSHRDLHNIAETQHDDDDDEDPKSSRRKHKSLQSVDTVDASTLRRRRDDDDGGSRLSLKPPISPSRRKDAAPVGASSRKPKKQDVSSAESSTEGDGSQQSQKSVVYLHAATVGDIPSPGDRFRKSASRDEIDSIVSAKMQNARVKTLSRSFSVLAPWRPKQYRDKRDIDYSQQPKTRSSTGRTSSVKTKIEKNRARDETASTLRRHRSSQSLAKSRENVATTAAKRHEDVRGSNSTLFRKQKDKKTGEKKKPLDAKKSMSLESLGGGGGSGVGGGGSKTLRTRHTKHEERVSRSKSMPKDDDRSAGWFRKSKNVEPTRG